MRSWVGLALFQIGKAAGISEDAPACTQVDGRDVLRGRTHWRLIACRMWSSSATRFHLLACSVSPPASASTAFPRAKASAPSPYASSAAVIAAHMLSGILVTMFPGKPRHRRIAGVAQRQPYHGMP